MSGNARERVRVLLSQGSDSGTNDGGASEQQQSTDASPTERRRARREREDAQRRERERRREIRRRDPLDGPTTAEARETGRRIVGNGERVTAGEPDLRSVEGLTSRAEADADRPDRRARANDEPDARPTDARQRVRELLSDDDTDRITRSGPRGEGLTRREPSTTVSVAPETPTGEGPARRGGAAADPVGQSTVSEPDPGEADGDGPPATRRRRDGREMIRVDIGEPPTPNPSRIRGSETALNIGTSSVAGPDLVDAATENPGRTAGTLALTAAGTPLPADDVAVAPIVLGLGALAVGREVARRDPELPVPDGNLFGGSELPATGREIRDSELPVGATGSFNQPELPATGEKGPTGPAELPADDSPVFDRGEIPVGGSSDTATGTGRTRDSVVPESFPVAGRDFPARPRDEFVPPAQRQPTADTAEQTGQQTGRQRERSRERTPFREPTGVDPDITREIFEGGGTLGEIINERQRRRLERRFPTGESAVVGRSTGDTTQQAQRRLVESSEPFLSQGQGTRGSLDPFPPAATDQQDTTQSLTPVAEQSDATAADAAAGLGQQTPTATDTTPVTDTVPETATPPAFETPPATSTPTAFESEPGFGTSPATSTGRRNRRRRLFDRDERDDDDPPRLREERGVFDSGIGFNSVDTPDVDLDLDLP